MDENNKRSPRAMLLIANGLFWAAAMIGGAMVFNDQNWGKDMLLWMIVGFSVTNGLLLAALGRKSGDCN